VKRKSYIILLLLYSCNSANDYLKKADTAINKENYREAIVLLDKALVKKKYLMEAYTEKGYCYTMLDRDDSALLAYKHVISLLLNNTLALFNSGNCKYRQGKYEDAIDFYNKALIAKGYNTEDSTTGRLVVELTPEGKNLLGIDDKFDVSVYKIFYEAGLAHYELGQFREAYRYFHNSISGTYKVGESYYMIAMCWLVSNNKEKACEALRNSMLNGYAEASKKLATTCK